MNQIQYVKDILSAIESVKTRAHLAVAQGDLTTYGSLMLDLMALERCLVYQTEQLVKEAA